nr:hypothetical protein [Bradyrhizobium neotropicale]
MSHETALDMIRSIKAFPIPDGARGQPKVDLDALAKCHRSPFALHGGAGR